MEACGNYTVSPLDWRVMLQSMVALGRSADGTLERDLRASIEDAIDAARQQGYREGRDAAAQLAAGRRALMGPSTYAMGAADMAEELADDIRALTPEDKTP